ncbi:MAG TPA: NAD(P)/FAD-dependent oxidoreductase [Polyangium sp.]|nr:NAD(P)/FAD-dependent oxidoreductase [Polyangium sp.]
MRVIVIGAGVSGLAAAKMLHEAGAQVTVLEARQRIGGRIFTDHDTFGVPIEIGAQYIHGTHNEEGAVGPVWQMAQEQRWATVPYSSDAARVVHAGKIVSNARQLRNRLEAFSEALEEAESEITLEDSVEDAVSQYLQDEEASDEMARELRAIVASEVGLEYAGDIDQIAIENIGDEGGFSGGNHILTGGYEQVPKLLASELPNVRLGEVVSVIDYNSAVCSVTTKSGQVYQAERILCTLPLGVLQSQSITFNPGLPPAKIQAISRMGVGNLGKVILEFSERFWPDDLNWLLGVKSAAPWGVAFSTLNRVIPGRHFLIMWHSGSLAQKREALNDDAVIKIALDELRTILAKPIPTPVKAKITRWSRDPFSCGAYFYPKVNSPLTDIKELARPVSNRLFFAGEATNAELFGTVHGAILSGRREAAKIIDSSNSL